MDKGVQKRKKYLSLGSLFMTFFILCRTSWKTFAMEEAEGGVRGNEDAAAVFIMTDGTGCFVHWIMIALTALFIIYQAVRFLIGRHKKVRVREFMPAGIYAVLMLIVLAFGDCYIDFIVMVSGAALAAACVSVTLVQYKKSVNGSPGGF